MQFPSSSRAPGCSTPAAFDRQETLGLFQLHDCNFPFDHVVQHVLLRSETVEPDAADAQGSGNQFLLPSAGLESGFDGTLPVMSDRDLRKSRTDQIRRLMNFARHGQLLLTTSRFQLIFARVALTASRKRVQHPCEQVTRAGVGSSNSQWLQQYVRRDDRFVA